MDKEQLRKVFFDSFGEGDGAFSYHSPGRINLIGEHTDYNGGYVFPCALSFGTHGVIRKRTDDILKFASTNFDLKLEIRLSDLEFNKEHNWANYLKGVVKEFREKGHDLGGFEVMISGNIPNGAGLSSSSSIELLMAVMLNDVFECNEERIELVKIGQRVENNYIGVQSGIMDQFAIGLSKKDHAIMINCETLDYEYVPLNLPNHKIIIANTNKRRELADSKYNERRSECEEAVANLNEKLDIKLLSNIDVKEFEENKSLIKNPIVIKRASHVLYENERVLKAVTALKADDLKTFGKLMIESHQSLRDLYEVTGVELDTLVAEALKIKGTLGSRMTGAGFGGCTISIVENDYVDEFIKEVGKAYKEKIGFDADFYLAEVGEGTKQL